MGIYCCFFVPSNLLLSSGHSKFYILGVLEFVVPLNTFELFLDSIFISRLAFKLCYVVSSLYPGANLSPLLSDCLLKTLLNVMYYGVFFFPSVYLSQLAN